MKKKICLNQFIKIGSWRYKFLKIFCSKIFKLQGLVQLHLKRIPHIRDEQGNTLLMVAARCGNEKAVKMLLVEHSNLNVQNVSDIDCYILIIVTRKRVIQLCILQWGIYMMVSQIF